jgi:hypothetical protein
LVPGASVARRTLATPASHAPSIKAETTTLKNGLTVRVGRLEEANWGVEGGGGGGGGGEGGEMGGERSGLSVVA